MKPLRLLIVDDEPLIRAGIRDHVRHVDGIEVIADCGSGTEAIEILRSVPLDLVLLDVQMPEGSGLDVVQQIGPERMPAIVFLTAYEEYAVKAFELNAIDYLLKPFDRDRLLRAIERTRQRLLSAEQSDLAGHLRELLNARTARWPERIVVTERERFEFVPVNSIDWIESANNYVQLHCGNRKYLLGESLTHLESRLDPSRFARVHRGKIINISRIQTIHRLMGGAYEVCLRSGARLTTGRQFRPAVEALIWH